jgi:hypothetical protein
MLWSIIIGYVCLSIVVVVLTPENIQEIALKVMVSIPIGLIATTFVILITMILLNEFA